MQPLRNLTNTDRAKLLYQLFPDQIPAFIIFEKYYAEILIRDQKKIASDWKEDSLPFSFLFWVSLAERAKTIISQYEKQLARQSGRFSDQLFDGHLAFFSSHCLYEFIKSDKCTSKKFALMVQALFSFE